MRYSRRLLESIVVPAIISMLFLNSTISVSSNTSRKFQEAITVHKLWGLDTIQFIKPSTYGMDSTLAVLDLRNKAKMRMKGTGARFSEFFNYTIADSFIVFLDEKRQPLKYKKKKSQSYGIFKITSLTNNTMVITASTDMGGKKSINIVDLYELHYSVRRD